MHVPEKITEFTKLTRSVHVHMFIVILALNACVSTVWQFFIVSYFYSLGSEIKLQDIKTEPSSVFFGSPFGTMCNDSKQGLVSVAITLRPAAAEVRILLYINFSIDFIFTVISVTTFTSN